MDKDSAPPDLSENHKRLAELMAEQIVAAAFTVATDMLLQATAIARDRVDSERRKENQ